MIFYQVIWFGFLITYLGENLGCLWENPQLQPSKSEGWTITWQGVNLTQVVHSLELLGDRHGASRFNCDYHPDGVSKEVPSGLVLTVMMMRMMMP